MAASPQWKVYDEHGEYIASAKYPEVAAVIVAALGGTVRHGHRKIDTVWTEGSEEIPASESYDRVANIMRERLDDFPWVRRQRLAAKAHKEPAIT